MCLRQITNRFPDIDFVLRSHSNASSVPYCIEGYGEDGLGKFRDPQEYIEEFARFSFGVNARYAVPFASNHIYLHRDTIQYNSLAVTADRVFDYSNAEAKRLGVRTETVLMPSGSRWDDKNGFACTEFSYQDTQAYIDRSLQKHTAKLEEYYAMEERQVPSDKAFQKYFQRFLDSLPPRWITPFKFKITFEVPYSDGMKRWLLDIGQRRLDTELESTPDDSIVIVSPAKVINDCCRMRLFATWTPSKRMKIRLPTPDAIANLNVFFLLLDLFELRILPLRYNFSMRAITGRLRRWREVVDVINIIYRIKIRKNFRIADLYPLPDRAGGS
jgi:UDP-MurNAc hydroxylase